MRQVNARHVDPIAVFPEAITVFTHGIDLNCCVKESMMNSTLRSENTYLQWVHSQYIPHLSILARLLYRTTDNDYPIQE